MKQVSHIAVRAAASARQAAVVVLILSVGTTTCAQVPEPGTGAAPIPPRTAGGPPEYREAIEVAVAEFQAGAFAEAKVAFERAHRISPNARTLRGLGFAAFELRRYAECIDLLQRALASKVQPLTGAIRDESRALLRRARSNIGYLRVELSPQRARLTIDGAAVESPPARDLTLAVGHHWVAAAAPGYDGRRHKVHIHSGKTATVKLVLDRIDAMPGPRATASSHRPPATTASSPARHDSDTAFYERWWFWTGAVAVVAGAVVAGVLVMNDGRQSSPPPLDVDPDVVGQALR